MKTTILLIATFTALACNCHPSRAQDAVSASQSQSSSASLSPCAPAAFLILEQGKLAGVDWVEYLASQVHTRTILTQSVVIDATIDLRPDQTAAHSSVVVSNAGEEAPKAPTTRDLGQGAIYLSDIDRKSVVSGK